MSRIEFNYNKDGLTQFLPILFVRNDKETAWLFGFWKKNIAIVNGRNTVPINPVVEEPKEDKLHNGVNVFQGLLSGLSDDDSARQGFEPSAHEAMQDFKKSDRSAYSKPTSKLKLTEQQKRKIIIASSIALVGIAGLYLFSGLKKIKRKK